MKTATQYKVNKDLFKSYVAERMSNEDEENPTRKDLIINVGNCLKSEYLFPQNIMRYKTVKNCLKEWLMGLPSCVNVDYNYYDIKNIFKSMEEEGSFFEELTEDQQYIEFENYWVMIAEALNDIHREETGLNLY